MTIALACFVHADSSPRVLPASHLTLMRRELSWIQIQRKIQQARVGLGQHASKFGSFLDIVHVSTCGFKWGNHSDCLEWLRDLHDVLQYNRNQSASNRPGLYSYTVEDEKYSLGYSRKSSSHESMTIEEIKGAAQDVGCKVWQWACKCKRR